jgi:hypothetical protein
MDRTKPAVTPRSLDQPHETGNPGHRELRRHGRECTVRYIGIEIAEMIDI